MKGSPVWKAGVFVVPALGVAFACSETVVRRPNVPPSAKVHELEHAAGDGVFDCGETQEPKVGATCDVHTTGECLAAALHDCRPAHGMRSFFTSESDGVRVDWFVIPDGKGSCQLHVVEDRSADPLAPRAPMVKSCRVLTWQRHETVADCEVPAGDKCEG
ncbi:MAG TPA: hypothetical protein VHC69_11045 [Polyangiaceae bacterium]|nr:hypothetical protein [Polyangiaceae bacterium]